MITSKLALAEELAMIRAEISRLTQREQALASIEHAFPAVPVFRRGWPMQRVTQGSPVHA